MLLLVASFPREFSHETSENPPEIAAIINPATQRLCSNLLFESIEFGVVLLQATRANKRAFSEPPKFEISFAPK